MKNKMIRFYAVCLIFLLMLPLRLSADEPLVIYTVNYPLQYFAERIAGDRARVNFPAPPDVDPAFWQPGAELIREYQQADLILLNGADYAKWTGRVSLPRTRTVDTSKAFRDTLISSGDGVSHSHGAGAAHRHDGVAFTTWLDFSQAVQQAQAIADGLIRRQPQHESFFRQNLELLEADLLQLDQRAQSIAAANPAMPLFASHPVYQYLARRYQLNIRSVLWEPEIVPDAKQWQVLQQMTDDHPANWMIWEGAPNPDSVNRLKGKGIRSLVYRPLGNRPGSGDFLSVMQGNLDNLEKAFVR